MYSILKIPFKVHCISKTLLVAYGSQTVYKILASVIIENYSLFFCISLEHPRNLQNVRPCQREPECRNTLRKWWKPSFWCDSTWR